MSEQKRLVLEMAKHVVLYSFSDLLDDVKFYNKTRKAGFMPTVKYLLGL